MEHAGTRKDGIQVFTADIPHRTRGDNRFQVLEVAKGQIVVEGRSRRSAEQRLLNYLLRGRFRIMRQGVWQKPPSSRSSMPVKVVRQDGSKETLNIEEPVTVFVARDGSTVLKSGFIDHHFLPDGRYNGWGTNTSNGNANQYEKNRKIESVSGDIYPLKYNRQVCVLVDHERFIEVLSILQRRHGGHVYEPNLEAMGFHAVDYNGIFIMERNAAP